MIPVSLSTIAKAGTFESRICSSFIAYVDDSFIPRAEDRRPNPCSGIRSTRPIELLPFAALAICSGFATARASEVPISQSNHVFSKETLAVTSGDWVLLSNNDGIPHDLSVTDEDGELQNLGLQQPGQTLRVHFVNAGEYVIRCALTPGMRLRVSVH